MPKPKEDQDKKGLVMEDMASEEVLKVADEAVKKDVNDMLDVLIEEEESEEDKNKKESKEEEDRDKEDKDEDKDKEDEDEDEDEEEDKDKKGDEEEDEEEESEEEESEEDKDEKKDKEEDKDKEPKVDVETAAKIARLEGRIDELSKAARAKDKEDEKEEKPKIEPVEFVPKDRNLEENPLTVEEYNKLFNQARISAYEEAIRSTPELVGTLVDRKVSLDEAVKTFYKENEDLAPIKDYVGSVANMVVSENPDWEITKVLEETEKRVRKNLDLEKKAEDTHKKIKKEGDEKEEEDEDEKDEDKKKKSPLATKRGGKSSRKGKDTRSETQTDIDDVVDVGA